MIKIGAAVEVKQTKLVGLALATKTTNANGQSGIDCGNLWQAFEKGNYAETIPDKLTDEIVAVYHQYEGDHTKPFSYFIGCKVKADAEVPRGLETLTVNPGVYQKVDVKGRIPDCLVNAWEEIWASAIPRAYQMDFEVYDERSKDWSNAEVDIYLSIKS